LAKEYECLTCHKPIKISKIDNPAPNQKKKWLKFELDGVTPHKCIAKKQNQQQTSTTATSDMSREITAIKAHLLGLVSRVDSIEQQMLKHSKEDV
jgi:hypothetical protein